MMLKTSCAQQFCGLIDTRASLFPLVSEDGPWPSSLMCLALADFVAEAEQEHREDRDQPVKTSTAHLQTEWILAFSTCVDAAQNINKTDQKS